jgi:hypothetical protein
VRPLLYTIFLAPPQSHAALINGDFETGDFTGWTFYETEFGGIGTPAVVLFDTNGDSIATNSARFNVGQVGGPCIGVKCGEQGGGIYQEFVTFSGALDINIDIAAESDGNNAAGGLFTLLFDSVPVDSFDFGDIGPSVEGTIERNSLSFSTSVLSGVHEIRILIERDAGLTSFVNDYVDNVTVSGAAVIPIPPSLWLFGSGILGLIGISKRKIAR